MDEQELRESIAKEIESAGAEILPSAKELGLDAYLVANNMILAFAAIARNGK